MELGRGSGLGSLLLLLYLLVLGCGTSDTAGEQRYNPAESSSAAPGMYSCARTLARAKHPQNCLVWKSTWDEECIRYNYPIATQTICCAPILGPLKFVLLQGLVIRT